MGTKFCYWTVADGNHGKMMATTVASARKVGVTEDFHIWTDMPEIPGAIVHPCGKFDKTLYMFKFHFLKNEVAKLDYDYFVFLDADNYFVSNPGNLGEMMQGDKVFIQMENDCDPPRCKRRDWWSCPIGEYEKFMISMGAKPGKMYNTNAGFWIVAKEAIVEFYDRATYIFDEAHKRGWNKTTEEFALAGVGMIMQNRYTHTFEETSWLWASDWTGQWKDKLPEYTSWQFEDYMSGDKIMVKPKIVHAMRSKDAMIKDYEKQNNPIPVKERFEVLMCCYGDYPDVSNKAVDSIIATKEKDIKIRVALNKCGMETKKHFRKLLDENKIETLYEFNSNINKDPAMRKLIDACESDYFLWLDDDTFPNKKGWVEFIEDSFKDMQYDVGGFTHVSGRGGYNGYKKFLEKRPWFKSWDKYNEYKDNNLKGDSIPFPIGFLWVGKTEYFIRNNFPDKDMVKKCDDMLLGEMIYQTNGLFKHLGSLWGYFDRNTTPRRGDGEASFKIHNQPIAKKFNGLTIYPTGSMCNRLRNLITSYELCKENNVKLKWLHELSTQQVAGVKFEDYWDIPKDIEVENLDTSDIMEIHNAGLIGNNIHRKIPKERLNSALHNHWGLATLSTETIENEGIQRLERGLRNNVIPLKKEWQDVVNLYVEDYDIANCVGVHMRSFEFLFGERKPEQNEALINNFCNSLSKENGKVFLATDSKYVQTRMKEVLGDKCIVYKTITTDYLERDSVNDFEHGLVDFYVLSRCKKVLGTKGSSYSHLAGILSGNLEWVIGARDAKEWDG